ncbi:MAG TPA: DUF4249 family protein [Saprospiraceae bacterium]|nr:DUF4249 family protein [Saprospiraceae bacterium]
MMKKYSKILAGLLLALTTLPGCFDEIQLDLPTSTDRKIVVEGYVNQSEEEMEVLITVGNSTSFDDEAGDVELLPLETAYLIYNEVPFPQYPLTNNTLNRLSITDFEQVAPSSGAPVVQLFVRLADGRIYQSARDTLPALPRIENIDVGTYTREIRNEQGILLERDFLEILLSTPLQRGDSEKALLRWEMTGVYRYVESPPPVSSTLDPQQTCYLPDDLSGDEILLFNGRETTETSLNRFPAIRNIPLNHFFASGYYITVLQQTLSPAAYQYWDQLRQNANPGGGLFDPTPGTVTGNIQNIENAEETVLGFFYATQTDTIRRLIRPGELGNPQSYCANPSNYDQERCSECTVLSNSTLTKPDYWIE